MTNYDRLYEQITLAPWKRSVGRTDPFDLGTAETYNAMFRDVTGVPGADAKAGLMAAYARAAVDHEANQDAMDDLKSLQQELSQVEDHEDFKELLDHTKNIFKRLGYNITY